MREQDGKKWWEEGQCALTRLPASLLWRFMRVRARPGECRGWFFSRSRTSTKPWANLYPYSLLSPQPPQIQSRCRILGLDLREQPHVESCPSRQARATECTTPAEEIACVKAASLLARKDAKTPGIRITKNKGAYQCRGHAAQSMHRPLQNIGLSLRGWRASVTTVTLTTTTFSPMTTG